MKLRNFIIKQMKNYRITLVTNGIQNSLVDPNHRRTTVKKYNKSFDLLIKSPSSPFIFSFFYNIKLKIIKGENDLFG